MSGSASGDDWEILNLDESAGGAPPDPRISGSGHASPPLGYSTPRGYAPPPRRSVGEIPTGMAAAAGGSIGSGGTGGERGGASDDLALHLPPGTVLADRYEVQALLGAGGMGAVYRVFDRVRGVQVALKVMLPSLLSSARAVERFRHEAEIALTLTHENIVRVYDVNEDRATGLRFYTMELLQGLSLRQWIEDKKRLREDVKLEEAIEIASQLLAALAYAHRTTVHRDLKPENVFLLLGTEATQVKVLDFGIAKLAEGSGLTATSMALGTAYYMAPEQQLDAARVDRRADLYSVSVILYEMIAGALPVGRFRKPSEERPGLARGLDDLVLAGLESKPERRPENAEAYLGALDRLKKTGGAAVRTGGGLVPVLVAAVLLLLLGGGGAAFWLLGRGDDGGGALLAGAPGDKDAGGGPAGGLPGKARFVDLAPRAGEVVGGEAVAVRGRVEGAEAKYVEVEGVAAAVLKDGRFEVRLALAEGPQKLKVKAVGAEGVLAETTLEVVVDRTAPELSLEPPDDVYTKDERLTVRGTVEDAHAVTLTIDGVGVPLRGGRFELARTFKEGATRLAIVARDLAGNETRRERTVVVDRTAPALVVEEPRDGQAVRAREVLVRGRVEDASPTFVDVGDLELVPVGRDGRFEARVALREGETRLTIQAKDKVGNASEKLSLRVSCDTVPPALEADLSRRDGLVEGDELSVRGTLGEDGCTVSVDGEPVVVSGRSFSRTYRLPVGERSFTVRARDRAGNVAESRLGPIRVARRGGGVPVPDVADAPRPGDEIDFLVRSEAADWTGEGAARVALGTTDRLAFFPGYRPAASGKATVHKVAASFLTITDWPTLHCPLSAVKVLRRAGEAVEPPPERFLAGLKVRVIHPPSRAADAREAEGRLRAAGAEVETYEVTETGNEGHVGKCYVKRGLEDKARRLGDLVAAIEAVTPVVSDDDVWTAGQSFNLWIASAGRPGGPAAAPAVFLTGLKVRLIYIERRADDARTAEKRLRAAGAEVEMFQTSDSGNEPHVGRCYAKGGLEEKAGRIATLLADIEALAPARADDAVWTAGQSFNVWIAGAGAPGPKPPADRFLAGLKVRLIHVARRADDARAVADRLRKVGAEVELFETDEAGNAPHVGKCYTRRGFEDKGRRIEPLVRDLEVVAVEVLDDAGLFSEGQSFNLWVVGEKVAGGPGPGPGPGDAPRAGDVVEFAVDSSAADWTGEADAKDIGTMRLSFFPGYRPGGKEAVVAQVSASGRFISITEFPTLYCPITAVKVVRGAGGGKPGPGPGPAPELARLTVDIFTPANRAFDDRDRGAIAELRGLGLTVEADPGPGGSNPDSNIKVAEDQRALGDRLKAILDRRYGVAFNVLLQWEAGDAKIFINLGDASEKTRPGAGGAGVPGGPPLPGDEVEFVVDDAKADWTGEEAGKAALGAFTRLSFSPGYQPGGKTAVVHRVGAGFFTCTEFKSLYCPLSAVKVVRRAGGGGWPPAADLARFRVVVFTPGNRKFDERDGAFLAKARALGFATQDTEGGGGSNPDANIKIASDQEALGNRLKALCEEHYGKTFNLRLEWSAGDTEIFINLGSGGK